MNARLSRHNDDIIYLHQMQYGGTVYILTNKIHTVLYIGVTADLYARIKEHKEKVHSNSFTDRYNCTKLLYYETFSRIEEAITKEKQMKKWKREWKEKLINSTNPLGKICLINFRRCPPARA